MIEKRTALAIISKNGKFLVLHRSPKRRSMPGKWQFVAGHMEEGETPSETAEREALEETTCIVRAVKEGAPFKYYEELTDTLWEVTPVLCKFTSGEVKIDKEHTEWRWASVEEMKKLDFAPMVISRLKQFSFKPEEF